MIVESINSEKENNPIDGFKIAKLNKFQISTTYDKSLITSRFSVLLVASGKIEILIQEDTHLLKPKDIIVIPINSILIEKKYTKKVQLFVIAFTNHFAFKNFIKKEIASLLNLTLNKHFQVIVLTPHNFLVLSLICKLLIIVSKESTKNEIEKQLFKIGVDLLIHELTLVFKTNTIEGGEVVTRKDILTIHFLSMLGLNGVKHHSANFYAQSLNVTSGYLNRVLKQKTGKTVKSLITEVIILEAKKLLSDYKLSSKEISQQLEFSSVSSFSNFFKKNTAMTPSEYRANK